jgi:hypothetical protein
MIGTLAILMINDAPIVTWLLDIDTWTTDKRVELTLCQQYEILKRID